MLRIEYNTFAEGLKSTWQPFKVHQTYIACKNVKLVDGSHEYSKSIKNVLLCLKDEDASYTRFDQCTLE